jgi:hypothetical protein
LTPQLDGGNVQRNETDKDYAVKLNSASSLVNHLVFAR